LFAAVCITLGVILECQAYTHVKHALLADYLHTHRSLVIAGAALLVLGVIAVHALVGAIRRTARRSGDAVARDTPAQRSATVLLLTAAALWIWGTVVVAALTVWQTITPGDGGEVRSFMRGENILANATLAPAIVLVICASAWLIVHRDRVAGGRTIIIFGGVIAATLVTLRGVAVLCPSMIAVSPKLAWIGLAAWIACVSVALRFPLAPSKSEAVAT
jgi:hypothetical protein